MFCHNDRIRRNAHPHEGMGSSQQKEAPLLHRQPLRSHRFFLGFLLTRSLVVALLVSICLWTFSGQQSSVHAAPSIPALSNGLAKTPPLGWSSWNAFQTNINTTNIEATADAIVSSGMKAAGYHYVNLDGGWWNGSNNARRLERACF